MSFFKNLFNKSEKSENIPQQSPGETGLPSSHNRQISQVAGKVFPVIKSGDWDGIEQGAIKQTIIGTPENPIIVVGFAYDESANYRFALHHELKEGTTPQNIVDEAYANIDAYPSAFDPFDGENGVILTTSGSAYSSEKILCFDFMKEAQEILNTDTIIVSIPRRTCMSIIDFHANENLINDFKKLHYHTYQDDSYNNAQITDGFFIVKDGDIVEFRRNLDFENLSDLQITENGEIIDDYEIAKQLYGDKKYEESKAKLLEIISKNPEHYEAQNYLAFLFERIEDNYEEAEKYYLMSLKSNEDYGPANINYASLLSYKKRFDEALKYLKKCDALELNKASLAFEWGYYYECSNQFEKAIEKYKENGMLIYNIKELEDLLDRIKKIRKKIEILEN